jgi:hypothetical protein
MVTDPMLRTDGCLSASLIISIIVISRLIAAMEYCQTGLSILEARDRYDAHTKETRILKINRTPQIATVADSQIIAEKEQKGIP